MSNATNTPDLLPEVRLDAGRARFLMQVSSALAVIGIILAAIAASADPKRFAFSYLTGFCFVLTLGLGGLFFVMLQHVTRAGWSVGLRRSMEWLGGILPICILLFIPIIVMSGTIFGAWMHPDVAKLGKEGVELIETKSGYLNAPFFWVRAAVYFIAWTALAVMFNRTSLQQDVTGDPDLTVKMQRWAAPAMYVFGITLTFAAFDWLMSVNTNWFSTIFGVYIFSGATTGSLAVLALVTLWLQGIGKGGTISTVEHRHDIGKLLFGFTIFWAYAAFAQFFLIWYANIPEETIFYHLRWNNSWEPVSIALIFGHFWIPFFLLLSRHVKRSVIGLGLGAVIMLVMHYVDLYWMIMPNYDVSLHISWVNFAGLLAPLGVLALWMAFRAAKDPLYPVRDPRLNEAAQFVNL